MTPAEFALRSCWIVSILARGGEVRGSTHAQLRIKQSHQNIHCGCVASSELAQDRYRVSQDGSSVIATGLQNFVSTSRQPRVIRNLSIG
jgi:hypothetical protein